MSYSKESRPNILKLFAFSDCAGLLTRIYALCILVTERRIYAVHVFDDILQRANTIHILAIDLRSPFKYLTHFEALLVQKKDVRLFASTPTYLLA